MIFSLRSLLCLQNKYKADGINDKNSCNNKLFCWNGLRLSAEFWLNKQRKALS